ncbi:MAG TPA: hypothetical protein VH117_06260 [Edaphobacter sp.]|nr:hypothetical protein [Edaphobacter sp.]
MALGESAGGKTWLKYPTTQKVAWIYVDAIASLFPMKTVKFPERTVESDVISFLLDAWEESDRIVDNLLQILQNEMDFEAKLREVIANPAAPPQDKFSPLRKVVREVLPDRQPYSRFEEIAAEIRMVRK